MASGNIKGITIQFNGDTTRLDKALRQINSETKSLDSELRQVNNALKFNPTSVELWSQKQQILNQKVNETKQKLDALKQAQAQMDAGKVEYTEKEYRELERQILVTENQVKNFETQLRQIGNVNLRATSEQFKQMGNDLTSAGQAMSGLSMAAAAVVASIGAMTVKSGIWADDLNTMAKIYHISTDELQKYAAAADLVDVDVETIAKSHVKLAKSMASAADGTGATADAFAKLGVSVTDSNGELRSSDEVWQDVIKALGNVENETERDTLAMQLMGKSAAKLNPLIEDGGKTYENVAKTMQKYGLDFIDQDTLNRANEFNDSLDTIKMIGATTFQQLGTQLAAYLAPVLEKVVDLVGRLANWFLQLSPETQTLITIIAGVVAVAAPLLIGLGKIAFAISSIISLIGVIGPAIGALVSGPFLAIIAVIGAVIAVGVTLYKHWDQIKAAAVSLGKKISDVWNNIKSATSRAWEAVKNAMVSPFEWAKEKISNIIDSIRNFFPVHLGNLFKGIKLPHFNIEWSSISFGNTTIDFPSGFDIEWYKKGGIFNSASLIGVGEAGPEAVVPLNKFWDKLDNMAAASGAPVINIYPGPNQSAREIAKEVERVLVQQQKQRAQAYGTI